jgi:hypothetical protein
VIFIDRQWRGAVSEVSIDAAPFYRHALFLEGRMKLFLGLFILFAMAGNAAAQTAMIPRMNIEETCRAAVAHAYEVFGDKVTAEEEFNSCVTGEKEKLSYLQSSWPSFSEYWKLECLHVTEKERMYRLLSDCVDMASHPSK